MKTVSKYQQAKQGLKTISIEAKQNTPTDKPLIRMVINDFVDYLSKDYNLTEHQRNLLSNYACKLHPKN
jgi:hypothetical protein